MILPNGMETILFRHRKHTALLLKLGYNNTIECGLSEVPMLNLFSAADCLVRGRSQLRYVDHRKL